MIIVVGLYRTGTSVMMECLKRSGFNCGKESYLVGHKYKTELAMFKTLGSSILQRQKTLEVFKRSDISYVDIDIIKATASMFNDLNINAFKDVYWSPFYTLWKEFIPGLKEAKIIYTVRPLPEVNRSMLRLQEKLNLMVRKYSEQFKLTSAYNLFYKKFLSEHIDSSNIFQIWHQDLIDNTETVKNNLSEFVGRDIDMSIVSENETWKIKRTAQ